MLQDVDFSSFSAGELSPRIKGRVDVEKYFDGADTLLNMVVLPQGGVIRRPGTLYVANALDQANPIRLVPFIFSTLQAYVLEFSAGAARVFMNDGLVLSGGVPVVITVPYQAADLSALKFTQSADTLYICHPKYPPATLSRSSHTNWTYAAIAFFDGPYLAINTTGTTLTPTGTSGSITITASATAGINATPQNAGQGFLASDVGRLIRIKVSSTWGWCKITAVNSTTSVTATVQAAVNGGGAGSLDGTSATANWRMGKWSGTTGYPYCPTFWQQRLMLAGTDNQPNALEGSCTGDFTNFAISGSDGTVANTNALSWVISDDQVNAIRWLSAAGSAQTAQLGIGTTGGEDIMQAASTATALTPTSVQVYRETALGSAPNVPPLRIGKSVLFVNRPGRKVHEWTFQWTVNGYLGPDLTNFAEHITRFGVTQWVYQQSPYSVVWAARADGGLIALTYLSDQKVTAWTRHQLGGQYYGGPPKVESLAVIPSPDSGYDELWLSVLRTVNGVPVRFIEVMTRYFDGQVMALDQAFFMDAGLTTALTAPAATLTVSAASGTGVTFIASAAVFSTSSVGSLIRANGGLAIVRAFVDSTHVTGDWYSPALNTAPAAANAWTCTAQHSSASGLDHLTGEVVQVLGDGGNCGRAVVTGGAVSVIPAASLITAGLPATFTVVTMPLEPLRAASFTSQGEVKLIDHLYLRLYESLGCQFGQRLVDPATGLVSQTLEDLPVRSAGDVMGQPPALFSGVLKLPSPGGYDQEGQIVITGSGPMPITILALGAKADLGAVAA